MSETRLRIGDLLVRAGLITEAQLAQALASQRASGRRLGEEVVQLGLITEVQMTQVLSNQLAVPWVSLYHVEWSRELLRLVPAELAERFHVVPVYVRHVRRAGDTLFVAMADPTNAAALEAVAAASGLPVKPMIAAPTDILNAIRVYYFGERPAPPPTSPPSEPPERASDPGPPPPKAAAEHTKPAQAKPVAAQKPAAEPKPAPKAKPAAAGGPRFVTLTLLDGTTVKLPAPKSGTEVRADESLTARDIVNALHARAAGEDVSAVLPDAHWETLVATLLEVLLRKGLVADWEFVAELEKRKKK